MTVAPRVRDAKPQAGFPPLALEVERSREEGGEIRNLYAEDRSQNVAALVVIGLLVEAATLAWLIYSFVF
jgi:hypothetical protein